MNRTILTAIALALFPSLVSADINGAALPGFWVCEEASQGMGTISQLHFQENGRVAMDFSMQRPDLTYPDSPDVTLSGRWALNGNILTVQSKSSSVLPSLSGDNSSGDKPLGEDVSIEISNELSRNLVHELTDESVVFVREGRDLKTRCFRKPE